MSVINTNITAMIGQQNLNQSQNALSTSMERLSSGLKINSAADDAAGQAIANRMSSQINGLSQAQSNANDGISVAQTTEGALNQVNDNLQRVRELTVQAQNGTNSETDLSSIQDEIGQRLSEIDRISEETSFNGVDVLASDEKLSIQVGSEDGQEIDINLKKTDVAELSLTGFDPSQQAKPETGDTVAINSTLGEIYELKNSDGTDSGTYAAKDSDGNLVAVTDGGGNAEDGSNWSATTYTDESGISQDATVVLDDAGNATVGATAEDGEFYEVSDSDDWSGGTAPTGPVTTQDGALAQIDSAIEQVDSQRSELGALQNRFDSAITNLSTTETNITSARSRIEDADYADEVSNMTKNQILQQAGTSVLSQANQLPQNALSLLG
ncbi:MULTISPECIES: FliC/FljB family flagellin [unclassified Chromohalobacter]|uniref:FliC/FljB family flagellin n=1 Tax=unclassified Chromohalobacter TaxID=2628571 RepID=UPI0024682F46|nr:MULTISPECIES: FliC/FljB family flagellin [unclassified Chromohalobacter]